MTIYSDVVSIAATTAGVTGTINVPQGAKLIGINLSATDATAAIILSELAIYWPNSNVYKYVPGIIVVGSTNGVGITMCKTPAIRLPNLDVGGANQITIKLTSTANITVSVGLMWIAP